jgi:tRNA 2-selenouridine synthase
LFEGYEVNSRLAEARADTGDYLRLFLRDVPLLDVRAPVEFAQGAFPAAVNHPLLDDRQRELVGIRYREAGQEAALALGMTLATPDLRNARLAAWTAFCKAHPDGYLYCFRGGLRSHTVQRWLQDAGLVYPLVQGGYKALRQFLLEQFAPPTLAQVPLLLLGGYTGTGKTVLLRQAATQLDLEGFARHRGSAFGAMPQEQPAQIDWENAVAIALLKHRHGPAPLSPLLLEDEGRLIGRIWVPPALQQAMKHSPLALLEAPFEQRVAAIREDYIDQPWRHYQASHGGDAPTCFSGFVLGNLARLRKRLGGARHQALHAQFAAALTTLFATGSSTGFSAGIARLLQDYYDPMYDYMLSKRPGPVVFRGDAAAVTQWLRQTRDHP